MNLCIPKDISLYKFTENLLDDFDIKLLKTKISVIDYIAFLIWILCNG